MDKSLILNQIKKYYNKNSDAEFARFLGISAQNLYTWTKRNTFDAQLILAKCPELNANWLLTGEGKMCIDTDVPTISQTMGVPYYNMDLVNGFDLIEGNEQYQPEYLINFKRYNEADCWCNITGHSMVPDIYNGDIIALKEIKVWKEYLPYGEVYGVVTEELSTVKRVTSSQKGESYFRLIPSNKSEEYQPQDIPKHLIVKVYKVLGSMKKL